MHLSESASDSYNESTTPTSMNFDDYEERVPWGVVSPKGDGDLGLVRETLRKEEIVKYVARVIWDVQRVELIVNSSYREILACQEDLRGV